MRCRVGLLLSASLVGSGEMTPALAQDIPPRTAATTEPQTVPSDNTHALGDIIVTAERYTSTEQKTAASITTRKGDDLTKQGRYSLSNILENVPGVTGGAAESPGGAITGGTDNPASGLTIRGIQSNSGTGGSITSTAASAAIYVDGVYNGIGGTYDIDRIEVLRGPQGTLYGRSATSGVVAIHTRNPDLTHYGADGLIHLGSYDLVQASAAVNIPIIDDKLAIRVSGNHYERDGFDSREGGRRQTDDARVKLLFKPNDTFSAVLGAALQYNKANVGGLSIDQPSPGVYVKTPQAFGSGKNHFYQFWGEFNLDLESINITYLPAYKTWYQNTLGVARGSIPEFDQTIKTPIDNFLTQELRIGSQSDPKLKWQAGVFYYYNNLHDFNELVATFPPPIAGLGFRSISHKRTSNIGVFGEATYALSDSTRLTGGLRYDYTRVRNEQAYTSRLLVTKFLEGDDALRTFKNVTYKARIEHDLTPVNMVYASMSTGFSPGDVAVTTDANFLPTVVELEAQTLTAYEIGTKNRFLGNRLQINGALFYNDYGGFQTAGINTSPNTPETPTFNTIVAPVKVYGAELEVLTRPWTNGNVGLNLSYIHARYDGIPAQYRDLFSTDTIPGTIPFQASAWAEHHLKLGEGTSFSARGELIYRSAFDASRITQQQQDKGARAYVRNSDTLIANLSATLSLNDGDLSITGYVRNIGNVRYKTNGGVRDLSPVEVDPRGFISTVDLSDPRTWGVTATARF